MVKMTLVRGIWIVWSDDHQSTVSYSRRFSNVETRLKRLENQPYVPLPNNDEFLHHVSIHLRLTADSLKFVESRDSCDRPNMAPMYSIPLQDVCLVTRCAKYRPVIYIPTRNWNQILLQCLQNDCLLPILDVTKSPRTQEHVHLTGRCFYTELQRVLLENPGDERPYYMYKGSPAVPMALAVLNGIIQLLQPLPPGNALERSKLHLLDMFIGQAMPFGRPIDVDPLVFQAKLQNKVVSSSTNSKQPAWKPLTYKGRANISLTIREHVKCVQYGKPDVIDEIRYHGSISCLALLEGLSPEISINITHVDSKKIPGICNLLIHPCVSSIDPVYQAGATPPLYKLRFMPPLDRFTLCDYMVSNQKDLPVIGIFKLRGKSKMDLQLLLKLNESITNSFEYFEVKLPFLDREIENVNLTPSWGMTRISLDRNTITWNLGNKFPSKTSEVTLNGNVLFCDAKSQVDDDEEKFSKHYYALVNFCTKVNLPSNCHIDSKSVHVSPPAKFKYQLEKELVTSDYKIWNSLSSAPLDVPIS